MAEPLWVGTIHCTLPTDQLFNLEFQFESVFNLEFQPKFGIQLGIPIPMGIHLGECSTCIINIKKASPAVDERVMSTAVFLINHKKDFPPRGIPMSEWFPRTHYDNTIESVISQCIGCVGL